MIHFCGIFTSVITMKRIRNILWIVLALCAMLTAFGGSSAENSAVFQSQSQEFSFVTGSTPVAEAQQSYIVAVPAASLMEAPSRTSSSAASAFLEEEVHIVFRNIVSTLPLPLNCSRRRLLLSVLRI